MKLLLPVLATLIFSTHAFSQSTPYVRPDAEKRFKGYLNDTVGPFAWVGIVSGAGIATARNAPEEWKGNADGFRKRVASNIGKNLIRNTVTYGLDEALRLDSRFYRSEKRSVGARVKNALISPVTARTASGKRTIGIPRIVGSYSSNIIAAEAWYPPGHSWKDGLRKGTISLGVNALFNLAKEFIRNK